jgi:hypothetical protein
MSLSCKSNLSKGIFEFHSQPASFYSVVANSEPSETFLAELKATWKKQVIVESLPGHPFVRD